MTGAEMIEPFIFTTYSHAGLIPQDYRSPFRGS